MIIKGSFVAPEDELQGRVRIVPFQLEVADLFDDDQPGLADLLVLTIGVTDTARPLTFAPPPRTRIRSDSFRTRTTVSERAQRGGLIGRGGRGSLVEDYDRRPRLDRDPGAPTLVADVRGHR